MRQQFKDIFKSLPVKIILVILVISVLRGFAFTAVDIEGKYSTTIGLQSNGHPQLVTYEVELKSSGMYYVYETRVVGTETWVYPVIVGTFYIDSDEMVIMNVGGSRIFLKRAYNNVLVGFPEGDPGTSITLVEKVGESVFTLQPQFCKFDIVGEQVVIDGGGLYFVTSDNSKCNFNVNVTDGTILNISFTNTGDAIVGIDFSDITTLTTVQITAGDAVFDVVVDPNNVSGITRRIDYPISLEGLR